MAKRAQTFRPTIFKLMQTEDKYTAASGLATIMEVFDDSPLAKGFKEALPKRSTLNGRSGGSYRLGLIQVNSIIYGHDALEDLEEFRGDPLLEEALRGEVSTPKTLGDFLRSFESEHIEKMNGYLSRMSRSIRAQLCEVLPKEYRPKKELVIDIDSTSHVQHGKKMEGCEYNYKSEWGLFSEVAFDDMGLCHGMRLAPGNTKPGTGSVGLIEQSFSGMKFRDEKYFRADSAYCWKEPLSTLIRLGVTFAVGANDATTRWRDGMSEITSWVEWKYSVADYEKAAKRNRTLPKMELGRFYWSPPWAESLRLPIVVKRTWKEPEQYGMLELPGEWKYHAVVTNFNLFHRSLQEVMEFYQKRGNAERYIREEKYGYDLKHFPCLKLMANEAYANLVMVAHNILRWVAIVERPHKPHFSKKLRRRYIYIPGRVIKHARQLVLKIPVRYYEEVMRLKPGLRFNPTPSAFASGYA